MRKRFAEWFDGVGVFYLICCGVVGSAAYLVCDLVIDPPPRVVEYRLSAHDRQALIDSRTRSDAAERENRDLLLALVRQEVRLAELAARPAPRPWPFDGSLPGLASVEVPEQDRIPAQDVPVPLSREMP